ncbi:MAG TPA: discoidin domain-containing protein, partial [Verrucomicrobiae bacterium]|nr:discoidin domain-containing protein [Verrucomicrobiae bacterium]
MKSKDSLLLGCAAAVFGSWISGAVATQLVDVTFPGDPIISTSSNSPGSEGVANAIDDDLSHTYVNFDRLNTGLTVYPRLGLTLVRGLTLTSANGPVDRDPTSYTLEGSLDGEHFTPIASGPVPAFPGRFHKHTVLFENDMPYRLYRLLFPTINGSSCCMQIAEIELLGERGPRDVTVPGDWITSVVTNSPGSDSAANAIDDQPTKYGANLPNAGLIVAPAAGPTVVTGLSLTSAENPPDWDPASYVLEGSADGTNFVSIRRGSVPPFLARFSANSIFFPENTNFYLWYRLSFPTVHGSGSRVELAEVEFLGRGPGVPACRPSQHELIRQQPADAFVWLGFRATFQVVTDSWRMQWYRNGQPIPGATSPIYLTAPTTAADEGARFHVELEGPSCER